MVITKEVKAYLSYQKKLFVLILAQKALRSFQTTYFEELRTWCTTQSWVTARGNTPWKASVNPFRLSVQAIKTSSTHLALDL